MTCVSPARILLRAHLASTRPSGQPQTLARNLPQCPARGPGSESRVHSGGEGPGRAGPGRSRRGEWGEAAWPSRWGLSREGRRRACGAQSGTGRRLPRRAGLGTEPLRPNREGQPHGSE